MVHWIRMAFCLLFFAAGVASTSAVAARDFPNQVLKIVTGYPTGSTTDNAARMIAAHLTARYGWHVIVENRAGASGNMGAATVARSAPDGYTILLTADNPITTNLHLFDNLGFDPLKDLRPITIAAANIIALATTRSFPADTLAQVIELAKSKPGEIAFGSSGVGSPHHLAGELFKSRAGIDIRHVAYKGGGPALADLAGGHIQIAFVSLSGALPFVQDKRIKLIAITEPSRYEKIPDVPAVAETIPGYAISSWVGLFAPRGVPDAIIQTLNGAIVEVLKDPKLDQDMRLLGLVPVGNSASEAERIVESDIRLRGELIRASGAKLE